MFSTALFLPPPKLSSTKMKPPSLPGRTAATRYQWLLFSQMGKITRSLLNKSTFFVQPLTLMCLFALALKDLSFSKEFSSVIFFGAVVNRLKIYHKQTVSNKWPAPVEHGCENMNSWPVLFFQHLPVEPGQEKVDDDVVEPSVMLQGLVVLVGDRHTGTFSRRKLAKPFLLLNSAALPRNPAPPWFLNFPHTILHLVLNCDRDLLIFLMIHPGSRPHPLAFLNQFQSDI